MTKRQQATPMPVKPIKNTTSFIIDVKARSTLLQRIASASILFLCLFNVTCLHAEWRTLSNGLEYQTLTPTLLSPWARLHVFRIDPKQYAFQLSFAKTLSKKNAVIHELAQSSNALIAINGGFFDERYNPLGLRISHATQKNPIKPISWWGIFTIEQQKAKIYRFRQLSHLHHPQFAVQSGPRLLISGHIPPLKDGLAERSSLGIDKDGRVIILATEHASLNTTTLASILRAPPLNCVDAINLDGGSSTQLYANIGDFKLHIHGFSPISDAVVVTAMPVL